MKARTAGRVIEIPEERVRGGVGGGAMERDSPRAPRNSRNSRKPVANPALSPSLVRAEARSVNEPARETSGTSAAPAPSAVVMPSGRSIFRSQLEEAYSRYLHGLLLAGDIRQYRYEPLRFNLAPNTTLTPDFQVILKDGTMEMHEVKGWSRDDAMAKLKICAHLYPEWKFWLVKRKRGIWELKELPV